MMACSLEKCEGNAKTVLVRPATEDYAEEAIEAVRAGKVIAVPTDTLYGFACDACSMEAVQRIYEIKGRKYTSPLAICVGDVQNIHRFASTDHLPRGLLDSLLPGPVTVVLRRGESSMLEKSLNPGLVSIGVRVPGCNFIRLIARGSKSALALTSANLSGQPSSVDVKDFENLWEHCAYIYNGGVLPSGRAGSTVVDLTKLGQYKILRPGRQNGSLYKQWLRRNAYVLCKRDRGNDPKIIKGLDIGQYSHKHRSFQLSKFRILKGNNHEERRYEI